MADRGASVGNICRACLVGFDNLDYQGDTEMRKIKFRQMSVLYEVDKYNWNVGIAICRSRKTKRLCYFVTIFCFGFMIMPGEQTLKVEAKK